MYEWQYSMWEVIIPMLFLERIWVFELRASGREEREEGTEGLILGSFDITCLGPYMVFINKGHEKCLNQGSVARKKKCCHYYTDTV